MLEGGAKLWLQVCLDFEGDQGDAAAVVQHTLRTLAADAAAAADGSADAEEGPSTCAGPAADTTQTGADSDAASEDAGVSTAAEQEAQEYPKLKVCP